MSEYREFPIAVDVLMTGYDTDRYAVVERDSVMAMQVQTTGFSAMVLGLKRKPVALTVDMSGDAVRRYMRQMPDGGDVQCRTIAVSDLVENLRQQLSHYGIRQTSSARDSLRLVLAPRAMKTLPVSLDGLNVTFADGYGLYGEPTVNPSEVTLYGPQASLDRITALRVNPETVSDVNATGARIVALEPVWKQYSDVRVSSPTVEVYIPVQPYVERTYKLPIVVDHVDSTVNMRLYPEQVTLRVWVAQRDVAAISASSFEVVVDYQDVLSNASYLTPRVVRFPDHVRVRSMEPKEFQYVIIQ